MNVTARTSEQIEAWERARRLCALVACIEDEASTDIRLDVRNRLHRAASVLLTSIAEGFREGTDPASTEHFARARGAACSIVAQLAVAREIGRLNSRMHAEMSDRARACGRSIANLADTVSLVECRRNGSSADTGLQASLRLSDRDD